MHSALPTLPALCESGRPYCHRRVCFQARLTTTSGQPVHSCNACGSHLGDAVCQLTEIARDTGLTSGQVTVAAIDATTSVPGHQVSPGALFITPGFPFGSVRL
jgi:hypothetical protein